MRLALVATLALAACAPRIGEGVLACRADAECPPDWHCHRDARCRSSVEPALVCDPVGLVSDVLEVRTRADVDILLVIDNSNSMAEEQRALAADLPAVLRAIASGDVDGDGAPDLPPLDSIHVGVVSTDMGVAGANTPTCTRNAMFGDDGVLQARGAEACGRALPSVLSFGRAGDLDRFTADVSCMATLGTGGCGFEQQLEAALKALTPSTSTLRFVADTRGHADVANAGFLRADSVLVVLLVTDEDDCSAADPELLDPTSPRYRADLNIRCFQFPEAVHPVDRYTRGLLALRAVPSQLVFAAVVGVPLDAMPAPGAPIDYDAILAHPQMQERIDPMMASRLLRACGAAGEPVDAFPPRRIVELARQLERGGARVNLASLCQTGFGAELAPLAASIGRGRSPCFRSADLPTATRLCAGMLELAPGERCEDLELDLQRVEGDREVCRTVESEGGIVGWRIDTAGTCGAVGQVSVELVGLESGTLRLECYDTRETALGRACSADADCPSVAVVLRCDPRSFTCQRTCTSERECGGGLTCDLERSVCSNTSCRLE